MFFFKTSILITCIGIFGTCVFLSFVILVSNTLPNNTKDYIVTTTNIIYLKTAEDVITYKNLNDNNIESVYWAKAIIISDSINCIKTTNCKIKKPIRTFKFYTNKDRIEYHIKTK